MLLLCFLLIAFGSSQQVGTNTGENHPKITTQTCTTGGGCTTNQNSVVLDSNWRWTHKVGDTRNCYTGNSWDKDLCPDPQTCSRNCAIDGADYVPTYGIQTNGNSLQLGFVTKGQYGTNIGSRVYLMAPDDTNYQIFQLLNKEFTLDIDVSNLPCGLNGALYFVQMDADGGKSKYPGNAAGSKYGTGYCDAQCPHDIKFINGEANMLDWKPNPTDPNSGTGRYGTCCVEMDIWEANKMATAYTPHVCTVDGQTRCNGTQCGDGSDRYNGVCDKDGCDFNSYRMGAQNFFGPSMTVDTTRPITVTTQFVAPNGKLSEIRRIYRQNGKVIQNSKVNITGVRPYDSVSDAYCADQKKVTGDANDWARKGGMAAMQRALTKGMVLVLSLWDDHEANMLWLDSNYPTTAPPSNPGVARGSCPITSGVPSDVERDYPNSSVKFSNIRVGDIGSTM